MLDADRHRGADALGALPRFGVRPSLVEGDALSGRVPGAGDRDRVQTAVVDVLLDAAEVEAALTPDPLMDQPPDPFEFLKNLRGPMGLPLAAVMAPTLIPDEVERRIAELKSVENWLNMNLNVLRMTIQGLEMQKAGLAAMQNAAASMSQGASEPAGDREGPPKK